MYQERKPKNSEVHAANPCGRQGFLADPTASSHHTVGLRTLEWIGPLALKTRYGVQPGVDRDFGTWRGTRHDQRIFHRRAALDSPIGLPYACDLTWDEYAVLATDVAAAAIEGVINSALAGDVHMSAEAVAGLLADHLAAPTPNVATGTSMGCGVEL